MVESRTKIARGNEREPPGKRQREAIEAVVVGVTDPSDAIRDGRAVEGKGVAYDEDRGVRQGIPLQPRLGMMMYPDAGDLERRSAKRRHRFREAIGGFDVRVQRDEPPAVEKRVMAHIGFQ